VWPRMALQCSAHSRHSRESLQCWAQERSEDRRYLMVHALHLFTGN
jgi:hypothetical protein